MTSIFCPNCGADLGEEDPQCGDEEPENYTCECPCCGVTVEVYWEEYYPEWAEEDDPPESWTPHTRVYAY